MLQDLSVYSWLDCEPDDLYKLTAYSLQDMQHSLPYPVPDYLEYWRLNGPGMQYLSPVLSALGRFSFTARPMQVRVLTSANIASSALWWLQQVQRCQCISVVNIKQCCCLLVVFLLHGIK